MKHNNNPDGTIWAPGTHQIYVNNEPARVKAPPENIHQAYSKMQEKIRVDGGLPLGIDHIQQSILDNNPILAKTLEKAKINPHDVGQITQLSLDGDKITIQEANITNQHIQELYDNGEIPAYSIVGQSNLKTCPSKDVDYVVDEFSQIDRVDFVMAGGCTDCRTENNILLAKLSLEDDTLTDEERIENNEEEVNETEEEVVDETSNEDIEDIGEEVKPITAADIKQIVKDIVTPLLQGNTQAVEAKLADFKEDIQTETQNLQIEAKTSKIETLVEAKIAAGYATPAMKKGLVANGLGSTDEEFKEVLASLSEKIWTPEHISNQDKPDGDGNYDEKAYLKECEKHGLDPI